MVSVQADCTIDEALVKMDEYSRTMGQTLEEVAFQVVEREIRFSV
jgi:hypothetical protein